MKKISLYWRIIIVLAVLSVIMALSAFITPFCDWYADHAYRFICDPLSHVTGAVPFAVGEIIMYAGILAAVLSVIFAVNSFATL